MTYTKTQRQLLLYAIFTRSQEAELQFLSRQLEVSEKTIQRDVKDLEDAGVLDIGYSRKNKAYLSERINEEISDKYEINRYKHLKKIKRLTTFMDELHGAANMDYDETYNCKRSYYELFPDMSEKTRFRDFDIMKGIGYHIDWDKEEARHNVWEDIDDLIREEI